MPGPDLRGLPSWLLRAPHGERQGRGGGLGGSGRLGTPAAGADGRGRRRLCGWTLRCSRPCCDGCSLACTSICRRWASGPCSTCPSGSCASSPAPCPSQRCCVSGTLFLARVSEGPTRWAGAGGGAWWARKVEVPASLCPTATADPDLGPGCWGVLRVVAVSHVSPVGGTAAPATISEITTGRAQHPRGGRAGVREASPRSMGQELERPQQWHSSGTGHCGGTADGAPGPSLRALRGQARLWEPRPLE